MTAKLQMLRDRVFLLEGVLHWRITGKPIALQLDRNGYHCFTIQRRSEGKRVATVAYFAHRAIWALHHGEFPKQTIDHINAVTTDNRIENLRDVSFAVNMSFRRGVSVRRKTPAPEAGIRRRTDCNRWQATAHFGGKRVHLGMFKTKDEAVEARNAALGHNQIELPNFGAAPAASRAACMPTHRRPKYSSAA